ncbi:MAG: helix-turn-helix domain-containing protein [bacterium]
MLKYDKMINELLTTDELASYLKVHEMTLYKLLQAGEIPAVKIGRTWRFEKRAINEWLKVRKEQRKSLSPTRTIKKGDLNISFDLEKREEDLFDVFSLKIELKTKVYRPK